MAGIPLSNDKSYRRSIRLALRTTLAFGLAQFIAWPLAMLAPAFSVILLIDPVPISLRRALSTLLTVGLALISGYFIALTLLPYPVVMVLAACLLMYRFFLFIIGSGGHLLAIVGMMIGCVLIPIVVKLLPELAVLVSIGMMTNFLVALICGWTAFFFFPAQPSPDDHHHGEVPPELARKYAGTMTLVAAPILIGFLLFGWTSILVLVYAVLIAPAMSSEGSVEMGWDKVVANMVFGGVGMWLFYELMVAVPNNFLLVILAFTFLFVFASQIFSGKHAAGLWLSGLFGFLILVGGALLSESVVPIAKALDRVIQIGLASLYIFFAYRVIELVDSFLPGRGYTK